MVLVIRDLWWLIKQVINILETFGELYYVQVILHSKILTYGPKLKIRWMNG